MNSAQHLLEGRVSRVTFWSKDNGYFVARLKVVGEQDTQTVVGTSAEMREGMDIRCEGGWETSSYGMQFKASHVHHLVPTSEDGILAYLSNGSIAGIGPTFAKKIVAMFGSATLEVIDNTPDRLLAIKGFGKSRLQKVIDSAGGNKQVREIMVFLQSFGITQKQAMRIHKAYGSDAIAVIKTNPYRLAKDVSGIGFKSADAIAIKAGIDKNSPVRIAAGVRFALEDAAGTSGHCGLPRPALIAKSVELLGCVVNSANSAVLDLLAQGDIIETDADGQTILMLASLYATEMSLAKHIKRLSKGSPPWGGLDIEAEIREAEAANGIVLSPSQMAALTVALKSKVCVITGGPGTGKSTILKTLLHVIKKTGMTIMLGAPTGKAAGRVKESTGMEAGTIHRMLEAGPAGMARNKDNPLELDVCVVDEFSMPDVYLSNSLFQAIPSHAAMIMVGDVDQLPSVGPGKVLQDLIDSGVIPVVRLVEIFRQAASSKIITSAHRINGGQMPLPSQKSDDFFFIERESPEAATQTIVDLVARRLPEHFGFNPFEQIQVLSPMNKSGTGTIALNAAIQREINPSGDCVTRMGVDYRVADKVIQTVNNYDKGVFNGDIGRIIAINQADEEIQVRFDKNDVTYQFSEIGEIRLAYAITIHKYQGSESPAVIIPLLTQHFVMLNRNLIYTGVTRGRKLVVLVGQEKALRMAVENTNGVRRFTATKKFLLQ